MNQTKQQKPADRSRGGSEDATKQPASVKLTPNELHKPFLLACFPLACTLSQQQPEHTAACAARLPFQAAGLQSEPNELMGLRCQELIFLFLSAGVHFLLATK